MQLTSRPLRGPPGKGTGSAGYCSGFAGREEGLAEGLPEPTCPSPRGRDRATQSGHCIFNFFSEVRLPGKRPCRANDRGMCLSWGPWRSAGLEGAWPEGGGGHTGGGSGWEDGCPGATAVRAQAHRHTPPRYKRAHLCTHRDSEQIGGNRWGSSGTAGVGTPFNRKGGDGR